MRKTTLLLLFFSSASFFAQEPESKKTKYNYDPGLCISTGIHASLWGIMMRLITQNTGNSDGSFKSDYIPFNVHIDKLFENKFVVGVGYTYNRYPTNPLTTGTSRIPAIRENVRLRVYRYLPRDSKRFTPFIGGTLGVSHWKTYKNPYPTIKIDQEWWPTAQFLFGFTVRLSDAFFWQSEFCVGPPYACQTALGIKF